MRKWIAQSETTFFFFFFLYFPPTKLFSASAVPGKWLQVLHGELLLVLSLQIFFFAIRTNSLLVPLIGTTLKILHMLEEAVSKGNWAALQIL